MSEERKPAYWTVIPADVRYDESLSANAKLIYGEISALADQYGYCYASNNFFAQCYGISIQTVRRLIKELDERDYIAVEVIRDPETNSVLERRIYAGLSPEGNRATPPLKNERTLPTKMSGPSAQNQADPSAQKRAVEQYNNLNNIPPIAPHGGKRVRSTSQEIKTVPSWEPDRFAGLWTFYPSAGRRGKQAAIRAWDKLKPSPELIDTMAAALVKLKASEEWQRGIGIPHVSTWINQRRWEDANELPDKPPNPEPDSGGWAEDPEVMD